jgi:hypothetical protein
VAAGLWPRFANSEQGGWWLLLIVAVVTVAGAAVEAAATEAGDASSVLRPLQIQFAAPAGPGRWRMTGRLKWPSPNHGIAPVCEWANDKGARIWLSAQLKELAVECADRAPDRWRELIGRSRELATNVRRRCGDHSLFATLCYLQLVAEI